MARLNPLEDKLITLIGGDGFLGSHVVQELLDRDARVRIAARHPEKAFSLKPLANLGQIQFARCNVTDANSIARVVEDSDAVVYLVGTFGAQQKKLQADGAGEAARVAAENGAQAFVYISAIGADPQDEESGYASTKGLGERKVLDAFPNATIIRPSIIFGEDDNFINMFARLIQAFRALPVFAPESRLQPVWVDDVAEAVGVVLADPGSHGGKTYELAGPEQMTMRQIHEMIAQAEDRHRSFIAVPDSLGSLFASVPGTPMNSDQYRLLKRGSIASGDKPGFKELGIEPKPLTLFLNRWMTRYRKHGRFTERGGSAGGVY